MEGRLCLPPGAGVGRRLETNPRAWLLGGFASLGWEVAGLDGSCLSALLSWSPDRRESIPGAGKASLGRCAPHPGPSERTCDWKREVVSTALHTRAVWEPRRWLTCSCCVRSTDLGILLGMALGNEGLEVWPLTRSEACAITGFLRDKLQYRNRLQYMVTTSALVVSLFQSPVAHAT